jgi:hypothetical protein
MSTGRTDHSTDHSLDHSVSSLIGSIPLPQQDSYSYSEAKLFSQQLDLDLGFQVESVEKTILENHPRTPWAGLDPQALQTPYPEIRMMLSRLDLQPGQTIVDLGAAYGRMGLVVVGFHPEVRFIGYEVSVDRAREGNRVYESVRSALQHVNQASDVQSTKNGAADFPVIIQKPLLSTFDSGWIELRCEDISRTDWSLPDAELYFIYDFGDLESIIRVIDRLKTRARQQPITVVGRGRRTRDHIERHEPWLSQVNPPDHCGNFSIYRS